MTESMENLAERLKRFQASQDCIERKLDEHTKRLGCIEITLAQMTSAQSQDKDTMMDIGEGLGLFWEKFVNAYAEQSVRIDRLGERIDRIERRLELQE